MNLGQAQEKHFSITRRADMDEYIIEGVKTTIPFHQKLMENNEFCSGSFTSKFMDTFEMINKRRV